MTHKKTDWADGIGVNAKGDWVAKTSSNEISWRDRYEASNLCRSVAMTDTADIYSENKPHVVAEAALILEGLINKHDPAKDCFGNRLGTIMKDMLPEIAKSITKSILSKMGIGSSTTAEIYSPSSVISSAEKKLGGDSKEFQNFIDDFRGQIGKAADILISNSAKITQANLIE